MPTEYQPFLYGFLLSTALLIVEHLTLYPSLREKGDVGVLARFVLGVLAILAGCGMIAWETGEPIAVVAPVITSASGLVVVAIYGARWLWQRAQETSYMRGRLHGLADRGDIHEDG